MTNQENEEVIDSRTRYTALTGHSPTPPNCPLAKLACAKAQRRRPRRRQGQNQERRRVWR